MHKINSHFRSLSNLTIAVLGVAFKAGTEDIRNSPATAVVKYLLEKNAYVKVYDAWQSKTFKKRCSATPASNIQLAFSIL